MSWLQEQYYMMGSQVMAGSGMPGASDPNSLGTNMHRVTSPSSASSVPYQARISLNPLQFPGGVQYPQAPYTANLNFNLINNMYKPMTKEMTEAVPSSSPPSSDSGSPRTDSAGEQTEPSSEGQEQLSGLEIMRQQIQNIPEQINQQEHHPGQQLSVENQQHIMQGLQNGQRRPEGLPNGFPRHEEESEETSHNGGNVVEIHDVEDEGDEEMHIDEEMADEGNASLENPIDDTFEEDKQEQEGEDKAGENSFPGFQAYLQPRTGLTEEGASSLEKLQQVLNNRMFESGEGQQHAAKRSDSGELDAGAEVDKTYGFQLPEDEPGQIYNCHLCTFSADSRATFSAHVNTHYQFQCTKCEFETKNEVEYCKHLRHEHNLSPEDLEEAEVRAPRVNSQGKVKSFKCKQCDYVAVTKIDFWKHGRGHIKPEKLLFCPKCIFVTEYKHHLEYHLRNHYGTKPFKCDHCNYSCVNKSMLNSHMKSHNNVYQYRCADCTYATKYCHSLKLHLKKYSHKPAMVLNQDGSPNPMSLGDVLGKGGKKGKGGKNQEDQHLFPPSLLPQFGNGFPGGFPPGLMQMMQMQQQLNNGAPNLPLHPYKPENLEEERGVSPPSMLPVMLRCDKCDFTTSSPEVHKNHMLLHATSDRSALHQLLSSPLTPKPPRSSESREPFSLSQRLSSPQRQLHQRPVPPFLDQPESPTSNGNVKPPQNIFLNNPFLPNPFLANLVPNPAIQALMEDRQKQEREGQAPSSPEVAPQSPVQSSKTKEEAPLPPNKRLKPDIFASLFASRLSELEKKSSSSPSSPPLSGGSVLDLSEKSPEAAGPIGGGSHGSSSDNDSASNPRSHSSSPSLGSTSKSRRKGKAFKIVQQEDTNSDEEEGTPPTSMPSLMPIPQPTPMTEKLMCKFCGISFQNQTMHTIHMGYHGYSNPFKCNHCGDESQDALSFFLHIARKEHS